MSNNRKRLYHSTFLTSVALSALAAMGLPSAAFAAGAGAATAAAETDETPSDIVVTARRREETLQDVPLAITAITGDQLRSAGAVNLRDIANLTPGLIVSDAGGQFYTTPTIRGQTQLNTQNGAIENNVSVFLNGVYLANAGAINLSLLNVDRVEVVKGPVSALYGRSAFAGAINYVSSKPSDHLTATIDGTLGNHDRGAIDAVISGQVTTGVRATIGGVYDYFGGTWKDDVTGNKAGGYRKQDVFGSLAFDLGPATELTLNGYYGKDHFGLPAQNHLDNNCAPNAGGVFQQYCGGIPEAKDIVAPKSNQSGAGGNDREVIHFDGTLATELGAGYKATLIGGYNNLKSKQFLEINNRRDGLTYNLVPGPGTVQLNEYYGDQNDSEDYSGEVRISSPEYDHIRFSAGGFYYHSTGSQASNISLNGDDVPAGQTIDSFLASLWLTPGGVPSELRNAAKTKGDQYSAFAEGEYKFSDTLSFAQEGRYTSETKHIQVLSSALDAAATFDPHKKSFHYWNTRSTLRYKPTQDLMFYVSAANGTKSGGFNGRATVDADIGYDPEKNWTYEAGVKGALFDRRFTYGLAVYHIDAKNLQIIGPNSDSANPGQVIKNYGGSKNTGFEIETTTKLADGVHFNLGFAYTDPKFTSKSYDAQYAGICAAISSCAPNLTTLNGQSVINLKGFSLPRQSKYQITTGINAETSLNDEWSVFGRADYSFQSKQYFETASFSHWGPTHMVNLSTGVKNGGATATVWVKNLLNQTDAYSALYNIRINDFVFETLPLYNDKRTIGATISFRY